MELIREVAGTIGISPEALMAGTRGTLFSRAKELLVARAPMEGYSLADLARALNCTKAALSKARKRQS